MDESAKSAERVRNDFQMFRNRSVVIASDEQCAICSVYLLLKPFFVFPCGHKFHGDCLETQLANYLCKYRYMSIHSVISSNFISFLFNRKVLKMLEDWLC